jgi:hypothetical protein
MTSNAATSMLRPRCGSSRPGFLLELRAAFEHLGRLGGTGSMVFS